MNKDTIRHWLKNPWRIGLSFARRGWLNFLPDKAYISILYRAKFGRRLDWKNPKTYNEKLQWLKVHDRKQSYCAMVDKYEVKQYVAERIGEAYIVPVLGGPWERFEEIDFASLPDQFVLKTTHDCGGVYICENKASLDVREAKKVIQSHLQQNYYLHCREWPYKSIKPRIFAEEYLADIDTNDLKDYKFFCFDGVPRLMFIASERQSKDQETKFDFYDMDFNHLPIINGHPNSNYAMEKPVNFQRMKELAAVLSENIPHLRVDFYESNGHLYLGELTFFHWGGFVPFEPEEWDEIIGSWLSLPKQGGD